MSVTLLTYSGGYEKVKYPVWKDQNHNPPKNPNLGKHACQTTAAMAISSLGHNYFHTELLSDKCQIK